MHKKIFIRRRQKKAPPFPPFNEAIVPEEGGREGGRRAFPPARLVKGASSSFLPRGVKYQRSPLKQLRA